MTEPHFDPLGMTAYRSPTEPLPRVPRVEYQGGQAKRHPDGLALVMPAMIRELVRREEAARVWEASVESISGFVDFYAKRGIPVSGDDRPDVRGGMIAP